MNIEDAIEQRQVLSFVYDGLPRTVQPATLGYTSTGKLTLRACLVGGASRRNSIPCWELFTVAKMSQVAPAGTLFEAFSLNGYTRNDSGFVSIISEH